MIPLYSEDRYDDSAAQSTHLQAAHWRMDGYAALSFTRRADESSGVRESTYRLHTMDLTTHRLVPILLGSERRECDHLACDIVILNSLAAGYLAEFGISNDHSSEKATELLHEQGWHLRGI